MAKTLLLAAVAAVLFALSAVSSSPAQLDQRAVLLQLQQLDDTQLQVLGLDKHNLQSDWITSILKKMEEALDDILTKISEAENNVEKGLNNVLQGIEDAALEAAAKWNETVVELAKKAQGLGVDVQDCILAEEPLIDVVEGLKNDARACVATSLDSVKQAFANLTAVGSEAQDLLSRAEELVAECSQKGNILAVGACLLAETPTLEVQAAGLVGKAALRAGIAAVKVAALAPVTTLCTSKAVAGHAAEASEIVDATAQCIRDKLLQ